MTQENKVFPFETPSDPPNHGRGSNGGPSHGERLASLEAKMDHAATREDVLAIKVSIERIEARMEHFATKEDIQRLKVWVLGGVLGALGLAVVVATGVVKLFT